MKSVVDLPVEREPATGDMPEAAPRIRASLASDIRATLQAEIESGQLAPGIQIDERALAARFNVSRTPVREALQHLAARDMVVISPRQGITVARLSIAKVRSMLEYVGELEALCARFSARRASDALRDALDHALMVCQQAAVDGDPGEYALANALFHDAIYDGSRNECLAGQIRAARRQSERYRVADFRNRGQILRSLQEHVEIARAIQAGDEARAAEAMLRHVPAGTTGFSEFLAAVPRHFFDTGAD
ncbi:transcriptional regulator, GntR family [Burkholderia sp. lig30]|jgi:DNA-binding GntR family transcriptional regulator|uniref:GntR family transcriptional regulator n=1 Tax=Burkholderia sp. lig30 TaxID=1192124 RepID=UPI0004614866|nr:GntR family transcriptional regulator [Burkholderia sp. lig30]KDB07255.1 transcriptional regulator, GntR family [Burkholderia sp. lig30]